MLPDDPGHVLFGVRLKIDRAWQQLNELNQSIGSYISSGAWSEELAVEAKHEILWKILRVHRPLEPGWSALTGEIVHNLRSALDYLVYQLVILETKSAPTTKKNQFPIFLKEQGFESRGVPQMLHGVGAAAKARIKSLQPFAAGENESSPLWCLQELSNRDKHHEIVLTAAAMSSAASSAKYSSAQPLAVYVMGTGFVRDRSRLYGRAIPPGAAPLFDRARQVTVEGEVSIHVTFEKPLINVSVPAQEILVRILRRVASVASEIHDEFFAARGSAQ